MKSITVADRLRYRFDLTMARGPASLIAWLFLVTALFVTAAAAIVVAAGWIPKPEDGEQVGLVSAIWMALMHAMDAGTVAGDAGGPPFLAVMFGVTLGGIFVVSILVGLITNGIQGRVESLRKGRSLVCEEDHTVILGWSPQVFSIVSELVVANESRKNAAIAILADRDKVEMEDELRAMVGKTGKTKIICRTGDPMNLTDLEIANPANARSIILLAGDDSPDPDADVIKTALALTNNPRRKAEKYHIVGELEDAASLEAATLVGRDEAHWVLGDDLIGRITVQSCRQSGLSVVYSELLDFDGDEIYFTEQPSLYGKTYFDAQLAFVDSTVMGLVKAGSVILNPAADTLYDSGDLLIVIAEDDSAIRLATPGVPDAAAVSTTKALKPKPERTLVLGYNSGLTRMLEELNEYVATGSKVTVLADVDKPDFPKFDNLTIEFRRGDSTNRAILDSLKVESFNHIIVLAYKGLDIQRADGKTLITLLQLRDIEDRAGVDLNIVSEMLDDRNRELAEVTNADDFIVSDKLISLMLSQVSENKKLTQVFDDLFSSVGSEVYLQPVEQYVAPGTAVNFYTVLEAARRRGETALGYRVAANAHKSDKGYGVTVNPVKTETVTFSAGDKIIVLAEG